MVEKNSNPHAMLDLIEGVIGGIPDNVNPLTVAEDMLAASRAPAAVDHLILKAIRTRDSALWRLLKARQCNRQGLFEQAEIEISKALALDDTWYPVHGEYARNLIRQGKKGEAAKAAGRAVELNSSYVDGLLMLGTAAFLQRRFSDAVQPFRRITRLIPNTKDGYYFLGRARLMMGKVAEVQTYMQRAQGSTTYGYRAMIRLGQLAQVNQDSVGALAAYLNASYLQPNNPFPLIQLSVVASQSSLFDKGVEYAKAAAKLDPKQRVLLARAHLYAGRADAAVTIFHDIIAVSEVADPAIVAELATVLANEKKWDEVEKLIDEHAKNYSHSFELISAKGRMEMARKAFDDAVGTLTLAAQLEPDRLSVGFMLARALFHTERDEEALQVLGKILDINPNHKGALMLVNKCHARLNVVSTKTFVPATVEPEGVEVLVPDTTATMSQNAPFENIFRFRPEQADDADHVPVSLQIYNHFQVVSAYVIRETKSRYANQKMGYLSAVLEPAIMLLVLLIVFKFVRNKQPGNMSLEGFLLTGLITLNFVTMSMNSLAGVVKRKRALLLSPQITSFPIRVGEAFIIAITNVIVAFFLALGFNLFGVEVLIADLPQVIFAIVLAVLMGSALGIIFEGLIALAGFSKIFMAVLGRVLFFTSGVFFSVDDLPAAVLEYVLLNPVLHLIEFVRNGFEPNYPMHGVSFVYVGTCTVILLLLALLSDKLLRDRVLAR